jgi:hypothetical protein
VDGESCFEEIVDNMKDNSCNKVAKDLAELHYAQCFVEDETYKQ